MMSQLKKIKYVTLVMLLFSFIAAGSLTSCREQKKKESTEHPAGEEHPTDGDAANEEHPTKDGDEHPAKGGDEHPSNEDEEHPKKDGE